MKFNDELIEAFNIRYGWSPEAVLSISRDDAIKNMTDEEFEIYLARLKELQPRTEPIEISYMDVINGVVQCSSEEEWDG